MRTTESVPWLLIALAVTGVMSKPAALAAAAQAPGAPVTREVDPGVINTTPILDRAELRAGRLEIRPGGARRVHQHDDVQFHLFILLTGAVQLTVGGQTIEVVPGQVHYIARGTPHGFRNTSGASASAVEIFIKPTGAANARPSDEELAMAIAALRAATP